MFCLILKRQHKTSVTMGIKEFFIRAVIRVSCYTLHPPLWDAVTWWTSCKMTRKQGKKKLLFLDMCFSLPLPLFYNTNSHCDKEMLQKKTAHTRSVLYKHVAVTVVHGFTTDGVFHGQGGAWKVWSVMTDKLKASTDKFHLKKTAIGSRLLFVFDGGGMSSRLWCRHSC